MKPLPEALGRRPGADWNPDVTEQPPPATAQELRRSRLSGSREKLGPWFKQLRFPLTVYAATRVAYLLIAVADSLAHGTAISKELGNWDGIWYLALIEHGYPTHVVYVQSTLGFLPLYPLLAYGAAKALFTSAVAGAMIVSTIGGFIATVIVGRLAAIWWDEDASRRAVLFFCLFPGSIVFSMVYSEGALIPLIAGSLLALERRRWVLAGLLGGAATAVGPVALAIIPALAVTSLLELRRHGWRDPEARRSLLAPLLSPFGVVLVAIFLYFWTGDALANYTAQHHGWSERSTVFSLAHVAQHLIHQILNAPSLSHPRINLNYVSGLLGAAFMIWGLVLFARTRPRIPAAPIVYSLGIAALTFTSAQTQPNPRMLICAFPVLMVVAYRCTGKAFTRLIVCSSVLLVVMSTITYVGTGLRP